MHIALLRRNNYQRMRWRNDGGWTTEIARSPASADVAFDWRVSIAEIERDGPFSSFAGCDRNILVLDGAGMVLTVDGERITLDQRGRPFAFRGEAETQCELLAGPTRDFNVMTRRDACTQQVWFRPMVGPMVLLPEAGVTWLVHVVSGRAQRQHATDGETADTGDTLVVTNDGLGGPPLVLNGGGELVLVRLSSAAT